MSSSFFQCRAQAFHRFTVLKAGQMRKAVRQETAQVRVGGLAVQQALAMQGIQRHKKAAPKKRVRASRGRECEAVRWSPAVQITPVQIRNFSVADKNQLHLSAFWRKFLQDAHNQAAELAGMMRQPRTGGACEAQLMTH
jgi:hypothetical protein